MKTGGKSIHARMNRVLKSIWGEFVYGGHFLALGDVVALYVMAVILSIPVDWSFLVIIYLGVFSANLFNRSDESGHDTLTNPVRVRVMEKYARYLYPVVVSCFVISVGLTLYHSGFMALIFALVIFLIAILYTTLFKKMTKYIIGFKSFTAALFYALMVVLLAVYYSTPINTAVVLMFLFYYLRIFISNAACDVKDVESDRRRGLKTVALYYGEKKTKKILHSINIASGLIIVVGVYGGILPVFSLALLLTVLYAWYYIHLHSRTGGEEVFANAVIDGEFIFWLPYIMLWELLS